jgi:hypothetical protein
MALDKLIDSSRLNGSLNDTAYIIGALLAYLVGEQTQPTFSWDMDDGFKPDIETYMNNHSFNPSGGIPNLDGRKVAIGTFSVSSQVASYTVTHNLGETPEIIVVFNSGFGTSTSGGQNGMQYMIVDTVRTNTWRINTSGSLIATGGISASVNATSTTFVAYSGGFHLVPNIPYFWVALGAKAGN